MIVAMALLACKKGTATDGEQQPVPATPTQSFGLNRPAALDGVTATVEQFKECPSVDLSGRDSLARLKEKLVGIHVVFEGTGASVHNFSHSHFKLSDSAGLTFRSTLRPDSACSPLLNSGSLAKGSTSRGWVLFQVPEKSSGLKVVLTNRRPYSSRAPDKEQQVTFEPER